MYKTDFGMIGLHSRMLLVPFTNVETVNISTKLLLRPTPITILGIERDPYAL